MEAYSVNYVTARHVIICCICDSNQLAGSTNLCCFCEHEFCEENCMIYCSDSIPIPEEFPAPMDPQEIEQLWLQLAAQIPDILPGENIDGSIQIYEYSDLDIDSFLAAAENDHVQVEYDTDESVTDFGNSNSNTSSTITHAYQDDIEELEELREKTGPAGILPVPFTF